MLVSVSVITYNQEKYISEALDSIIMQQTDFPIEIVLGDDCSTDSTRAICLSYKEKYPDIIRLRLPEKNMGSMPNWIANLEACEGKYIAICEGDDYWTDPLKLRKQVDLMEANPRYSMCGHASSLLLNGEYEEFRAEGTEFTTEDVLERDWLFMTASIMVRREMLTIPEWYREVRHGDFGLQLLCSLKGNIGYLSDDMCVYRKHAEGLTFSLRFLNQACWMIYLLDLFNEYTNGKYSKSIKAKIEHEYQNQIKYAREYHLRRAAVTLALFHTISPIFPFLVRRLRK